jgi:hypothetical protein
MATATITLVPQNIAAAVQSLKSEFAKANMSGVKTIARRGALYVEMPIAHLSDYEFSASHEHYSWKTPRNRVVIQSKGFAVEQQIHNNAFSMVFRLPRIESNPRAPKKISTIRHIFFQRSLRAIEELQSLDEKKLAEAVQAPTDYRVLLTALNSEEALASIRAHDPLAGARIRGLEAKRNILEAEGGALSTAQIARAFKITRQAVDKRRKERKLLGVELGKKGYRYPVWQVGLPRLAEVLDALGDRDSWERIAFFLNPSALLSDRTPLEILQKGKNNIDVLRAAAVYGEQGA